MDKNTQQSVEQLQEQEKFFLDNIGKLGSTLAKLDEAVKNHEAHSIDMSILQKEKDDITTEIIAMKAILVPLNEQVNVLTSKKSQLASQIADYEDISNKKNASLSEIETNKKELLRIQSEITKFNKVQSDLKSIFEKNKSDIKEKIVSLHEDIKSALVKLT